MPFETDKPNVVDPKFSKGMMMGVWLSALFLLVLIFNYWEEGQLNPNHKPQSKVFANGRAEVILQRNRENHYVASGYINGQRVTFLLDTGATDVVVPMNMAKRLNLQPGQVGHARTANGVIRVYDTVIDQLDIGDLQLVDIDASLNPSMQGDHILLGMSALGEVELLQQGNQLRLRTGTDDEF